ncbi:sensor domain-containing diguanylate cyclase [Halomonas sp. LBP4]|uniref:sensor domain-containing diguanylate cyclase n=1 Tax=Halomonas sp. LBP4 TaxID=2044917 RepID=UPI000D75BD76|nr:diguanylate cyclase [Halomonas sp. LBP4]PXX99864.1 diguanylate cyclase [Halomonas sp. LBP4]
MIGLAATWVVVALLLLGSGWLAGQKLVRQTNFTHLSYESHLIAEEITVQVDNRLTALERLSSRLDEAAHPGDEAPSDEEALRSELRHNDALLEWFDGLVVADAEGEILADWPVVRGRTGLSTAETEYFRFVKSVRRPYVSEPFIGRASDMPLVMFVVPRSQDGEFAGFVGGFVNIHSGGLFQLLHRRRLGSGGFAAVATASGTILYHPDSSLVLRPVPSADQNPRLHQALDGWQGEAVAPLIHGGKAYQSFGQVWPADWVVGVFLPAEQVHAPLQGLFRELWWFGVGFALLLLPLMWWLVRHALTPLHRLERQIDEVGEGRRRRVTLETRMHEISRLAGTFNRVEGERSAALERLRDREAFLDGVLSSSPLGMFVTDTAGSIRYMNPALTALTGHGFTDREESAWVRHIHSEDHPAAADLWQHSLETGDDFLRQFRYLRADGDLLWLEVHASQVAVDGRTIGFVGTVKDITERHQQEALRRWEAEHDPLTGLLNRRGFERRLEEALAEWHKTGTPSALMLFDLDRFKPINDQGGHALGDEMLRRIAQVVAWEVRRSDHVARQGGDEFGVLLPSCTLAQARRIAETLREAVAEIRVRYQGHEYRVTLSVGVTAFQEGDRVAATVIRRADAASYRAKAAGRNLVEVA